MVELVETTLLVSNKNLCASNVGDVAVVTQRDNKPFRTFRVAIERLGKLLRR